MTHVGRRSRLAHAGGRSTSIAGAAALVGLMVWRLGGSPFLIGVGAVSAPSLAAAGSLGALATVACAWRWVLVARGLGVALPLPTAIAAYYRSQFLNLALPGGVLGDVQRGASHGREVGDLGAGLRAVMWERTAGQVVHVALALVLLAVLPSPVRSPLLFAVPATAAGVAAVLLLVRRRVSRRSDRLTRTLRAAVDDARRALLVGRAGLGIVATSCLVVAAHLSTFVIAARTAGAAAPAVQLLPLGVLVLLAMALPLSVAGWGPREVVAAPLFGAAGLSAGQGIAATTAYAVLALAATLPGALVLVVSALSPARRHRAAGSPQPAALPPGCTQGAGRA